MPSATDRSHPKSLVPYLTAAAAPKSDRRQRPPPPQPRRRRRPPPPQLRHRPEPPSPPPPHPATPAPLAALNPSTAGGGPHHHSPAASSSHPTAADRRPPRRSQSLAPTTAQQRRSTPTDRGVEHRAGPLPLRPLRSSKQRASLFSGEQLTATSTSSPFPQAAERPSSSASSSATSTSTSSLWTGLPPEHPLSEHLPRASEMAVSKHWCRRDKANVVEMDITFGIPEVVGLLGAVLTSETALTDVFIKRLEEPPAPIDKCEGRMGVTEAVC
ncbi:uncharacterized protein [Aegilops tauschii subsp. strangulata]|uniref:uncharacterized protein n=1 Tax=Aegilops tauschii subsp. strangulata TaxID=200361 RepID=UPI000989C3D4